MDLVMQEEASCDLFWAKGNLRGYEDPERRIVSP